MNVPRFTSQLTRTLGALSLGALLGLQPVRAGAAPPPVPVLHLEGEINDVTASYIASAVGRAEADRAGALVVVTNTPGGFSSAMDDIVSALVNARVPVAVYVSPSTARAASAGLFIAQAADVLAMAPGTNIGSAHPVTGSGGDIGGDLGRKVLNDAVARIRNLAALHHRNSDWCELAVRQSVNIGADEAVRIGVANLVEPSLSALLRDLDGRAAPRPSPGPELTFHTAAVSVLDRPMSGFQQILQALIDPNVAYLLMLVAVFGLLAEVSSPGAILPGVIGGISAILSLVAFSTLPINLAGVLLVALAFLLFVVDVKAPTHGVLTVGGLAALLLGSGFLLDTGPVDLGIDWRLIVGATAASAAGLFLVLRKAVHARSRTAAGGTQGLIGALGEARSPLDPEGRVFVAGAVWRAVSAAGSIAAGQMIRVIGQNAGGLRVLPAGGPEPGSEPGPHE